MYITIIAKVELLLENKVETKDALLHAINEEYVEAVEVREVRDPWVRQQFHLKFDLDCFFGTLGTDRLWKFRHLIPLENIAKGI